MVILGGGYKASRSPAAVPHAHPLYITIHSAVLFVISLAHKFDTQHDNTDTQPADMKLTPLFLTLLAAVASVDAKKKGGNGNGDSAAANVQVAQYSVVGTAAVAGLWMYLN